MYMAQMVIVEGEVNQVYWTRITAEVNRSMWKWYASLGGQITQEYPSIDLSFNDTKKNFIFLKSHDNNRR